MDTAAYAGNGTTSEIDDAAYRSPPANIEAEQALLGAILVNNEAYYQSAEILEAEHFFEPLHQRIYSTIGKVLDIPRIADPVTLAPYFENDPAMQEVGGTEYLVRLNAAAINTLNVRHYARTIFDLAVQRGLIAIGEDMVNEAYSPTIDDPPTIQIERAEQRLYELAEKGKFGKGFVDFLAAARKAMEMAEAAFKRDSHLSGLATHLTDLDQKLGGLQASDLIVLAGRPGMGKTSLATNIAVNVASHYKHEAAVRGQTRAEDGGIVGFFSLEMSAEQLATRILSEQSEIPSHQIRRGWYGGNRREEEASFRRLAEAAHRIENLPLHIDDTGGLNIASLASRARRLQRQQGLDLLIVDYIQLLQPTGRKRTDNRVQEITEITQNLKALAKELNIPIIALSQLSRAVESREDKRPQLADLRESGSIEQDADVVLFVYREEYYLEMDRPAEDDEKYAGWEEKMINAHGRAEVIIGKQRHGPVGTVPLHFNAEFTRFGNLVKEDRAQPVNDF